MEDKYKKAIERFEDKLDHIGVYPKSVVGKYRRRTRYMNGWNAAIMKIIEDFYGILEELGIDE